MGFRILRNSTYFTDILAESGQGRSSKYERGNPTWLYIERRPNSNVWIMRMPRSFKFYDRIIPNRSHSSNSEQRVQTCWYKHIFIKLSTNFVKIIILLGIIEYFLFVILSYQKKYEWNLLKNMKIRSQMFHGLYFQWGLGVLRREQ